jgi:hypothetical protein
MSALSSSPSSHLKKVCIQIRCKIHYFKIESNECDVTRKSELELPKRPQHALCRVGEVPVVTLVVVAKRVGWLCPPVVRDNAGVVLPTQKPDNAIGLA